MDVKYAFMIAVVYVVMFYGSGMPVLYIVATVYFFATYWADKTLVFGYYRKPEMLDEKLAR